MRVVFAADHAGAAFKDELIAKLAGLTAGDHELIDLGGDGSDPEDDYPDFAQRLGLAIQEGRADRGILVCGSGVGASVAANKLRGIRTAVCHDTYSAHQGVEHDDMNVLTLGARVIGIEPAVGVRARVPRRHVLRRAAPRPPAGQGPRDRGRVHGRRARRPRLTGDDGHPRRDPRGQRAYARAFAAGDAEALVALFEPDGGIVDGSARDALGHDALREMLAWGSANLRDVTFEIDVDWVKVDGLDPDVAHAGGPLADLIRPRRWPAGRRDGARARDVRRDVAPGRRRQVADPPRPDAEPRTGRRPARP